MGFNRKEIVGSIISGFLLGISFPPFPFPYLLFVALVPYLLIIQRKNRLAEISKLTYLTFFVFSLVSLYWVSSWMQEADPFLIASGIALIFFNPILFLIPSTLFYLAKKNFGNVVAIYFYPFFFVLYEFLYGVTEFRFPWLTLGNGLAYFTNYIQIADIIGVYGLSLLVLFANVLLTNITLTFRETGKIKRVKTGFFLLIVTAPIIYGAIVLNLPVNKGGNVTVGLIQPNFNPWKKWDAGNAENQLEQYLKLSRLAVRKGAEIIIWPETALPIYLLSGSYPFLLNKIKRFVDSNKVSLVTGMPHVKIFKNKKNAPADAHKSKYSSYYYASYNATLAFLPNQKKVQEYGKIKLVPFGEKVPYVEYFPWLENIIKWNVGISSWNVGTDTTIFKLKVFKKNRILAVRTAPIICIESIYSDFVAQFVKKGAEFITVVTNDSWYGNSSGPYQHEAISFLRAVENRRYVVRAANGGISCIINQFGKSVIASKMYERTIIVGKVRLFKNQTFFTKHPLLIPYIALFILIAFVILVLFKIILKRKTYHGKNN